MEETEKAEITVSQTEERRKQLRPAAPVKGPPYDPDRIASASAIAAQLLAAAEMN